MLFNTSYKNKDYEEECQSQLGKPYSFLDKVKMNGVGSSRLIIVELHDELAPSYVQETDIKYASIELNFTGKIGDIIEDKYLKCELLSIKYLHRDNYYTQIATFSVTDKENGQINILMPENRFYNHENQLSKETDIFSYVLHDIYLIINNIRKDKSGALIVSADIHKQRFISFIWLSIFIIANSFVLSFCLNKYKKQ